MQPRSKSERAQSRQLGGSAFGRVRARSAVDVLLRVLVGAPVVTVTSASELIGRSFVQTNEAVNRLAGAGLLRQVTVGRRSRAFEAQDIIAAFGDLERQLASPEGDTSVSKPGLRRPATPAALLITMSGALILSIGPRQ